MKKTLLTLLSSFLLLSCGQQTEVDTVIVGATGGKIKFTNKTEVPICYALWTDPRVEGFPASNYGVIEPGASHEYSKNSGDYSVTACMSGDMGEHHDWLDTDY
jgi:hypothetical protein